MEEKYWLSEEKKGVRVISEWLYEEITWHLRRIQSKKVEQVL